jgi:hypothetical protein
MEKRVEQLQADLERFDACMNAEWTSVNACRGCRFATYTNCNIRLWRSIVPKIKLLISLYEDANHNERGKDSAANEKEDNKT